MSRASAVRRSIERFGIIHTLFRGIEYLPLQTAPSGRLYWWIAPKYYYLKRGRTLEKYGIEEPFEPRNVSPTRISKFSDRGKIREGVLNDIGTIEGGEWDIRDRESDEIGQYAPTLEETVLYQSMESHFLGGEEWENTEIYDRVYKAVVDEGRRYHGCESAEDVDDHFQKIDQVYKSIKRDGYKSQKELRQEKPSLDKPFGYLNERVMEVAVDIGRNGELLLVDGRHRLSIAKILELENIPVMIIVRHEMWIKSFDGSESLALNSKLDKK